MEFSSFSLAGLLAVLGASPAQAPQATSSIEMQFVQKLAMCDASLFEFIHANQ